MPPEAEQATKPEVTTPAAAPAAPAKSPAMQLVADVLSNTPPQAASTAQPSAEPVDDDPDTEDENVFGEFDKEIAKQETATAPAALQPPEAVPAPAAPATPPATPQAPAGAPATPAAAVPASAPAQLPTAEPGKPTSPVQPPESWVPPNLFEGAQPAVPATPAAPAAAAPAAPVATPPAAPAAPAALPTEPAQLRERYMGELAQYYTPKDEEARALMLEPEKVVPKMFARLHVDVLDSVIQGIGKELPGLVQMTVNRMIGEAKASKGFYERWPQLAKTEYTPTVQRLMAAYKGQFPQSSLEQMITDVGAAAMVGLKLPLPGMEQPAAIPTTPHVTPINPGGGTGVPGGRVVNEFERLANDWDTEERVEEA